MIPATIGQTHVRQALQEARRDGVPPKRRSRGYCLVDRGLHFAPKYIVALAHRLAHGRLLPFHAFNGGEETNRFLSTLGFATVRCRCGGLPLESDAAATPKRTPGEQVGKPHTQRCKACKRAVKDLLEALFGTCEVNHRFAWLTDPATYRGTKIQKPLERIVRLLRGHRGFRDFIRRRTLDPCDFFVPSPGFIVEFDEDQHFTAPRALALDAYPEDVVIGFDRARWRSLCCSLNRHDNRPPYRDEQRAWYDALRDLVPVLHGLRPTVRLYAGDRRWCALDPRSQRDRDTFLALLTAGGTASRCEPREKAQVLRVAVVFPDLPREGQHPRIPSPESFGSEPLDLVFFPEGYLHESNGHAQQELRRLARRLACTLAVGVEGKFSDPGSELSKRAAEEESGPQLLLLFPPDGSRPRTAYRKHSNAGRVAFQDENWTPDAALPVHEIAGVKVGFTICHDSYLPLLQQHLVERGAQVWLNPSYSNPLENKWRAVLRLRAVEMGIPSLCTLHKDPKKRFRTHPFGFLPDGRELDAWPALEARALARPLSNLAPGIYRTEIPVMERPAPPDLSALSSVPQFKRVDGLSRRDGVKLRWQRGKLMAVTPDGSAGNRVNRRHHRIVELPGLAILDAARVARELAAVREDGVKPILWNHWDRLPVELECLVDLLAGRAIDSCAPIVISDRGGFRAAVELSNREKFPRWVQLQEKSNEFLLDIDSANGFEALRGIIAPHFKPAAAERLLELALPRYLSLAGGSGPTT